MSSAAQSLSLRKRGSGVVREYAELFKSRITTLIVITAWCGAYLAARKSGVSLLSPKLLSAALGIGFIAAGTAGLNEIIERKLDSRMRRTCMRPLVTGAISVCHALVASVAMMLAGSAFLGFACNVLSAFLALCASVVYLGVYTPMKTVGPSCTFIGAFSGAMPTVLGWTAVRASFDREALALFAIVFFWQFPHFHSIALLYREDYERAGVRMLAVIDRRATARSILAYSLALIPVSLVPVLLGMSGWIYFGTALLSGVWLFWYGIRIWRCTRQGNNQELNLFARQLLRATIFYLPALFSVMLLDRHW